MNKNQTKPNWTETKNYIWHPQRTNEPFEPRSHTMTYVIHLYFFYKNGKTPYKSLLYIIIIIKCLVFECSIHTEYFVIEYLTFWSGSDKIMKRSFFFYFCLCDHFKIVVIINGLFLDKLLYYLCIKENWWWYHSRYNCDIYNGQFGDGFLSFSFAWNLARYLEEQTNDKKETTTINARRRLNQEHR